MACLTHALSCMHFSGHARVQMISRHSRCNKKLCTSLFSSHSFCSSYPLRAKVLSDSMPGYHVIIYCVPWPGDQGWCTALWQSTPTQELGDYEGWYMETPYRPLHTLLPAMNGVPLGRLSQQPRVVQAMAAFRIPNFEDHLSVIRAIAPTYQVAYCFANFEAGLDLYIRPSQGLPGYLKYVTRSSWDPSYWYLVADWFLLGLFPLLEWDPPTARPRL